MFQNSKKKVSKITQVKLVVTECFQCDPQLFGLADVVALGHTKRGKSELAKGF